MTARAARGRRRPSSAAARAGREVKRDTRRAGRELREAAANPWFERLARFGYMVRGLLYTLVGYFALRLATHPTGARAAGMKGVVVALTSLPGWRIWLGMALVGLAAYALWGFIRAIYDPMHRGDEAPGIMSRLGFAWSGTAYTLLILFALHLFQGASVGSSDPDSQSEMLRPLLTHQWGRWIAGVGGLIGVGAGVGQFVDAYRAPFKKDVKPGTRRAQRRGAEILGRLGMISRGVIFTMLGWFVVQAAITEDAGKAGGMSGAMSTLAGQPLGRYLLGLVAVGFIALGVHSVAMARYTRWIQRAGD
jgi:hypothetical protein